MKPTDKEVYEAMRSYDQYKKDRAFKALFEKSSWAWDVKDLSWYLQIICWLKTMICLLLDRTKGSYMYSGSVCVLAYDERQDTESTNWDSVWVTPKLFSGWQICLTTDGT